jgi:hypothetical protein
MKKKYYHEFLSYFRYLKNAGLILSGEFYKPRVEQKIQDIFEVVDKFIGQGPDLLQNVLDETERNLYSIAKDDKESYLTGILKDFIDIAPYLNDTDKKEPNDGSEGQIIQIINEKHHHVLDSCHELILRYELNYTEHFDNLTSPQQYVILCYRAYKDFFNHLNTICLNFGIDIIENQRKNGFQIWHWDDVHLDEEDEKKGNKTEVLSQGTMRDKVKNAFKWMTGNDPRKHKLILDENDFEKLIDWITYYFDNKFSLPEIDQPIKKVNTAKGNVVYTFMKFFKDEFPSYTRPVSLFELISCCFYEYRKDKIENLKKTKEPQFYSELINKNK